MRAVGAAHAAAAYAPTPEGAAPAVDASAPPIGGTAVSPTPLGSAPVLRVLTPVVRVVVVVPWEAGMGLAEPQALESSSLISSKDPSSEGSARRRSIRGDPLLFLFFKTKKVHQCINKYPRCCEGACQ